MFGWGSCVVYQIKTCDALLHFPWLEECGGEEGGEGRGREGRGGEGRVGEGGGEGVVHPCRKSKRDLVNCDNNMATVFGKPVNRNKISILQCLL